MNTYKIDKQTVKAVNLKTALESLGCTGIEIIPLWRGKSNGKYKAYCNKLYSVILCEWIEKRNEITVTF